MKILLSAYACEPDKGSEAAVGWGWAFNLARFGHDVCVVTRKANQTSIERANSCLNELPGRAHFVFVDLPRWARFWKRGKSGVHLYYVIWQILAFRAAKRIVKSEAIDIVHHVTFVTCRMPSFMGWLGKPFIFGPVAGGEYSPCRLWWPLGWRSRVRESIRKLSNLWIRFSPSMRLTCKTAELVLVTSDQTRMLIPSGVKAKKMLAVASDDDLVVTLQQYPIPARRGKLHILYAGDFIYLKGMEYGLLAISRLFNDLQDVRLTLIGDGVAKSRWQRLSHELGIADRVHWIERIERESFISQLTDFDIFLFPSLHDSGGMVVIEAMSAGLPVVCLNVGGPGELVDSETGVKVALGTKDEVIDNLHQALFRLCQNHDERHRMGINARSKVSTDTTWQKKIQQIEKVYALAKANAASDVRSI